MITPSFGLTATERVLPRMALDFTTASLDSRVTFTRTGNTATVVNSSGYIAPINADLPRFDFNPVTLACKGLLIEESRTNTLTDSETFSTTWTGFGASISSGAVTSPTGAASSVKFVESVGLAEHGIFQAATTSGSMAYSVYAKFNGRRYLVLRRDGVNFSLAVFDLQAGVVTQTSACTASIEVGPAGFYRCTTYNTTTSTVVIKGSDVGTGVTSSSMYTGDGVSGFYLYGAQLEAGAFQTSYIPTVASQVTRTADVATMTGTNFSSWYNQAEGAVYAETSSSNFAADRGLYAIGNPALGFGSGEMMYAVYASSQSGKMQFNIFDGGALQSSLTPNTAQTINTFTRSVFAYKASSNAASVSAISPSTGAGSVPTPTAISIGSLVSGWSGGAGYLNGYVAKLSYYPQRLINNEVQAFSK